MNTNELRRSVRSKLEAAIRAQRESWDTALEIAEITGYAGDIYAFIAETAGALKDDEPIPDDLVRRLVSPKSRLSVRQCPSRRQAIAIRQIQDARNRHTKTH